MYKVNTDDIRKWVESYNGDKFHAILTDPPYNLESITKRFGKPSAKPAQYGKDGAFSRVSKGFMGKEWDTDVAFDPDLWRAIKNFLYPGAFGLAYMGARTYHKLATALEIAGFIIHPMIGWIHQGLPKPTRIDRQIERLFVKAGRAIGQTNISKLAKIWEGHRYGLMALKPCLDPVVVFQNPYEGKPLKNIVTTGAGALNIAGTEFPAGRTFRTSVFDDGAKPFGNAKGASYTEGEKNTLYPATVVIDEFVEEPYNNFFYKSRAMPKEKDAGLDGQDNDHPSVKPVGLNVYFSKLLLPPDHYTPRRLLVPFSGTGSEIIGGLLAGWDYVEGVELEEESVNISEKRIKYWLEHEDEAKVFLLP